MRPPDSLGSLPRAPGPPGLPLLGSLLAFRGNPFQTLLDWHRRYGEVVAYRLGPRLFHMVSHPALAEAVLIEHQDRFIKMYETGKPVGISLVLGQGLVTSRGELWKRQRRMMQPIFHRSRLADFGGRVTATGEAVVARWRGFAPGASLDVSGEMMRATLEVITRTLFNMTLLDRLDQLAPALFTVLRYSSRHMSNPLMPPLWVPTPENRAFRRALRFLDELILGLIRARRASGVRYDDLLDKLLYTHDPETGHAMSDCRIRDETLTLFIAGHETTAVALSWVWYLLAAHPAARERLHAEVDMLPKDRAPGIEDLPDLPYTRAVFEEALRLYPPALGVIRRATENTELDGCPVPAGSLVFVNIANIHRHGDFWEEPDRFRPERFLAGDRAPGHRLAFMPFGAGHRVCLGNHFAMAEGVLLLAAIARHFQLELTPGQKVEPEIVLTLRPKGGLAMRLAERAREFGATSPGR